MELTFTDKVRKVFMTRKGFVMYMLDKNALGMKHAVESSQARLKDAETSIAESIQQSRSIEAENVSLESRKLEIDIKIEGLQAEYHELAGNKRSRKPEREKQLAQNLELLIEEQLRAETKIARNADAVDLHNQSIHTIRRNFGELRYKAEELQAKYDNIIVRRKNVQAMEKTKVALEMIESIDVSENAKITEAIIGASERQHENWQENRELSGKNDTNHNQEVSDRLSSILSNERKAIK